MSPRYYVYVDGTSEHQSHISLIGAHIAGKDAARMRPGARVEVELSTQDDGVVVAKYHQPQRGPMEVWIR